jgi:F-type H+-transporting ATPase subunit epsilon
MIHVELITPEKVVFNDQADFVAAPSALGEVGILPNHAPLLAQLVPGEIRLKKGGETHHLVVTGGFLEVQQGSRVAIFAETAEFAQDIDVERARLAAERAKARMVESDLTGKELAEVEGALSRALLRIKIADVRRRRQPPAQPLPH